MRRRILAIGAAAALAMSGLALPAHAADQAQLSVLHAVPGLTVDVYVNGERTLNNFKPGTLAGPLEPRRRHLHGGDHRGRRRGRLRSGHRPGRPQARRAARTTPPSPT